MAGGTYQMMFVLAAMTLLSQITLTVNRYVGNNLQSSLSSEATITATGLAQSMMPEVGTLAFDENTVDAPVLDPASLTAVSYLGPESGEPSPPPKPSAFFDDIDDFDGYEQIVTTKRLGDFRVRTQVWYVDESDLENPATTQTFLKRLTVTVDQNPSLEYAITVTKIITY